MAEIDVTIEILSPIHLGSGQADVNIDAEIVHDSLGLPYFPGKRFKGLLFESALEIWEMFELSELDTKQLTPLEKIFHRHSESDIQLIVPNFFICPLAEYENLCAEWKYLHQNYSEIFTPSDVLNSFTSLRYQTQIDKKTGTTKDGSLHNLRVLDAGLKFYGRITLLNADEKVFNLLALAIKNMRTAGTKRNRGFGQIKCSAVIGAKSTDEIAQKILGEVV